MRLTFVFFFQEEGVFVKKKREYKKRKHKQAQPTSVPHQTPQPSAQLPHYTEVDVLQPDNLFSSEEEGLSPVGLLCGCNFMEKPESERNILCSIMEVMCDITNAGSIEM